MKVEAFEEKIACSATEILHEAGKAIMDIYESGFSVELKNDRSPLTKADKLSHEIVAGYLKAHSPFPVLSEEGKEIPFEERMHWEQFWLLDPLDGTKEFIKRNGEFTVNLALIRGDRPVAGAIYVPAKDILYYAAKGMGSYKQKAARPQSTLTGRRPDVSPWLEAGPMPPKNSSRTCGKLNRDMARWRSSRPAARSSSVLWLRAAQTSTRGSAPPWSGTLLPDKSS